MLVNEQYGITPLHQAASRNQLSIAEALITAGSDPNAENWVNQFLHPLAATECVGQTKETPMHFAKQNNHHAMIDFLKSRGGVET